jgi:RNA 2',3'-cyclic 3'-phosphodiesterase
MKTKRLFIGNPLPAIWLEPLVEFQLNNAGFNKKCKWVQPQNLHITTLFIGDFPLHDLPELQEGIEIICRETKCFELDFEKIVLKKGRKNAMIWTQFKENQIFTQLHKLIRIRVNEIFPLPKSRKQLIPHITLARINRMAGQIQPDFGWNDFPKKIEVKQANLWESKLRPTGAIYSVISSFQLSPVIP